MIVLGISVVASQILCFWLGRMSARSEVKELRADVYQWATLCSELHEENCDLRKAAL